MFYPSFHAGRQATPSVGRSLRYLLDKGMRAVYTGTGKRALLSLVLVFSIGHVARGVEAWAYGIM